ncbi:MAG: RNA polymerase sigma factor [Planctomycetota bacterium]
MRAEAFTEAFAHSGRALWVIASAWVGRDEAEDLVQETARVAWQRRQQLRSGDPPGPWLAAITRRLGANWRRRRRPEVRAEEALPERVSSSLEQAEWPFDVDRAGLSDELAAALARLPEVARASLLLHVVLGYGFAEVGEMLGINENTAASHARRARLQLREALTPVEER